ncbi:MAG: T9SS type A sorting domain-containing protein [Bacteroidia bacterium]|nr:T9SS type A sorting domain-containing protein [Bacteroidia bacterium]
MKYNYRKTRTPAKIFALMMLMALWLPSNAQVIVPFTQRTSTYTPTTKIYNIKGDFQMIGNTNMTLQSYSDDGNNSSNMIYVDVDGLPNTLNSSSATLEFPIENDMKPECSNIIYAGLYWIGRAHDGTSANTFSVTKSMPGAGTPTTVNFTGNVSSGNSVNYTTYTMTVTRQGSTNNYYPRYSFSSTTSGQPTVQFEFLNATPYIRYRINNGSWIVPTNQSTTNSGDLRTTTFTPVTIYSESGGITLSVDRLVRDSRTNRTVAQYISNATARVSVTGTYTPPADITKNYDKSVVYLKHASEGSYTTISAQDINFSQNIYYPTTNYGYMYSAYAEVTEYVNTHGLGEYTVADIALREGDGGDTGFFGGWGMIVVYENSLMNWRDVTIFDGHAYVEGGDANFELPVSGFRTAQGNAPIEMKLGLIAGEGDRDIAGDYFQILPHDKLSLPTPAESDWVYLSHSGNSTTNFFNSSIPATAPRNPSYTNNTGVDIAMFNIDNTNNSIITNNQTSTTFRYGSTQDTYIIPVIAMAVDAYIPDLHAYLSVASLNGNPFGTTNSEVLPGGEMEYKLDLTNPSEPITNASIMIPIPYTAEFVSASAVYYLGTGGTNPVQPEFVTLGASKYLRWYIGDIPTGGVTDVLATLTFKLAATDDCFLLVNENCSPKVLVEGVGSGTGVISGTPFTNMRFIRGYRDGICKDEPILGPLSVDIDAEAFVLEKCESTGGSNIQTFKFCQNPSTTSILFSYIANNFPAGSRFYNAITTEDVDGVILVKPAPGATEYTSTTNFPNSVGTTTYYALPPGAATCWWEFKITVEICNLWLGNISNDWGTAGNWTQSQIPTTINDDVYFATSLNWYHEAERDLILDQDRAARNIVNYSSKKLIIPINTTLTVDNDAETGSASQLVIQSEVGQANGALVLNNPTGNTGLQATVEFASKSKPGTGTWPRVWQFFGVPIVDKTLTNMFGANAQGSIYGTPGNVIVRKYNEALNLSYSYQEKWEDLDPATHVMMPYVGYEITQPVENTKHSFVGTLVTDASKTLNFTISPTGVYSRGNYILANPYAAPIFISKMLPADFVNLAQTIYIYNTGSRQQWIDANGYSTVGDQPGTYTAIPINAATTIGKTQIPSLQAFMVKASAETPAPSFRFRYETVYRGAITDLNEPMRIKRAEAPAADDIKPLLTMDVIGETGSDRVYLITAEGTGKSYDAGWDGYKTLSTDNVQLYAMDSENKRMQVNTDNNLNDTYIGFRTGGESTYTLKFKFNNEMQGVYESLYVQDLATGITQQITDGMMMTFVSSAGTAEKRFRISGERIITGVNNALTGDDITLKYTSSSIMVNNNSGDDVQVTVFNLVGQPLLTEKISAGVNTFSHNLLKGTYIIEAKSINNSSKTILKAIIN